MTVSYCWYTARNRRIAWGLISKSSLCPIFEYIAIAQAEANIRSERKTQKIRDIWVLGPSVVQYYLYSGLRMTGRTGARASKLLYLSGTRALCVRGPPWLWYLDQRVSEGLGVCWLSMSLLLLICFRSNAKRHRISRQRSTKVLIVNLSCNKKTCESLLPDLSKENPRMRVQTRMCMY